MGQSNLTEYNKYSQDMKTGDILLWSTNSLLGKAIRWRTGGDVNHASMIIRMSEYEGLERRRFHTEALERGVYPNLLSNRLKEYSGKVWWLPLKDEWDEKRTEIGCRLTEMWGIGYDYRSLLWQLVGKVNAEVRRLFCSEVCFVALGFTGKVPNPVELGKMDIYKDKVLIL